MVKATYDVEITPREVREAWTQIQDGAMPFSDRQAGSATVANIARYRGSEVNAWIGASGADIQHRLQHGYDVGESDVELSSPADYVMPQVMLDEEEGDLLVDQVLSGEDFYRAQWTESEAKRSLTIRACIGMHAGADAQMLGAYNEWILKVIDAAQRNGITPRVELWIGLGGCFQRAPRESMTVRIPLVEPGEMVDVTSWRAYLTPGAFRSLGFVAIGLAADKTKRRLTYGMGSPTNKQWSVALEDDVLTIECPGGAPTFPEEELDRMLGQAYGE